VTTLNEVVADAKAAMLDLIGLMISYELDFPTLGLLLEPGWPEPVRRAYSLWVIRMNDVARVLAHEAGVQPATVLSAKDRQRLTVRAFTLVMD
jgi:hypothetical protein